MEWIEGTRLEKAVPQFTAAKAVEMGNCAGVVMAYIHSITFLQPGYLNSDLEAAAPISIGPDGLVGFLQLCLIEGLGGERLGAELTAKVIGFAETEGGLLDTWHGPPCLAHADFGGSNIPVKETADRCQIAAVLDWEFAFSGSPFFELGNLLRPPLGNLPGFEQAVERGYREAGGIILVEWRRMSLLTDLTAWADFLNRPNAGPTLIRDAKAVIARTVSE